MSDDEDTFKVSDPVHEESTMNVPVDPMETETLIQNQIRKFQKTANARGLFGSDSNHTLWEVLVNFLACKGVQIKMYRYGRVESVIFRLIYVIWLIVNVVGQVFLRGWGLMFLSIDSDYTNVGFWLFFFMYCGVSIIFVVFAIMPLCVHETRLFFLILTTGMALLTGCFGFCEIIVLCFVVTSETWIFLVVSILGDLCTLLFFWVPITYVLDLIRLIITEPARVKRRRGKKASGGVDYPS